MVNKNIKIIYMLSLTMGAVLGGAIMDRPDTVITFIIGAWCVYLLDKFFWSKQW